MPNDRYVANFMCSERLRLSDKVTKAVQANYDAKNAHDRAVENRKPALSLAVLALTLANAREAKISAVFSLDQHRREHGC